MTMPGPGLKLTLIKGSKPVRKPKPARKPRVKVNHVSVLQPGGTQRTVVSIGLPEEE